MINAREEIMRLMREEYDPHPNWELPAREWDDNAEDVADKIIAAVLAEARPQREVAALMDKADNFERAAVRNYRLAKAICDNINEFGHVTDHELYDALDSLLRGWHAHPDQTSPMTVGPEASLCEDCPPLGYPTDITRCSPCPLRAKHAATGAVDG